MAQIAERAGLQQSSIYYWFRSKAEILGSHPRAGEPDPAGHRRAGARRRRARWPCGSTAWCARTCWRCAASRSTSTRSTAWPPRQPEDFAAYWEERRPPRRRGRGAGRRGRRAAASCGPSTPGWRPARCWPATRPRRTGSGPTGAGGYDAEARRRPPGRDRRCASLLADPATFAAVQAEALAARSSRSTRLRARRCARQRSRSAAKAACCVGAEGVDVVGLGVEERQVVGRGGTWSARSSSVELAGLGLRRAGRAARRRSTGWKRIWSNGRSSHGHVGLVARRGHVEVPDRHGAPDELVAARALHAVHAEVGAADADGVLGRPGAGRVVLRGHEAVAGVERRGHRRAEVDVAEAEHEVAARRTRSGGRRRRESSPLTRRMNSRFDGHHGASSRTTSM